MHAVEHAGTLSGRYHDVLLDRDGRVRWDRGWRSNAIVTDCRRVMASFFRGAPASGGLVGLQVGAGRGQWDSAGTPTATSNQKALEDPRPFTVPAADLKIDFLAGEADVSATPTTRLRVQAELGPHVPNWPDDAHLTGNLREFGLVAELDGQVVLINYVTHLVIAKDPDSTLQRTIWLTF